MRLFLLTALVMLAFAANSVLNRAAVGHFGMVPLHFALIRVASGALTLSLLAAVARRKSRRSFARRGGAALALSAYMLGFSAAYLSLDAGLGALILFGTVQLTMIGAALISGTSVSPRSLMGALVALVGLAVLLWPGGAVPVPAGAALAMMVAGLGWGVYSLLGRGEADALAGSAANFRWSLLPVGAAFLWFSSGSFADWSPAPIGLAILSGAVTSGLGYALWYRVLPQLDRVVAAVAQLSVPLIAVLAGALMLAEVPGLRSLIAMPLVLGGIALTLRPQRRIGSNGS